jgi:dihydroorotate dehydrogenase (NAD+) catalytic subunit
MDLSVTVAGIRMKNPIMPASGCFGFGEEYSPFFDLNVLGAIVGKSITLKPRQGNPPPRTLEVAGGMLNFIGLENPGVEAFLKEKLPFLRKFSTPIIVSIAGEVVEEYRQLAGILSEIEGIAGIEVNISCPNIEQGGMAFGADPETTYDLIRLVVKQTSLPVIAKLTPNVTSIVEIAQQAVAAGAQAISLINTLKARAKIQSGPYEGKWMIGGLSGPAIKPIALQKVWEVAQARLGVPIIGMGGIMSLTDVLEFLEVGATAVAIGTANFIDPEVMPRLIRELASR